MPPGYFLTANTAVRPLRSNSPPGYFLTLGPMVRPFDDLILQILSKIIEIIAVTCHTNNEVPVPFRMSLGILQGFSVNYIKLYMMTIKTKIAAYQSSQIFITILILKK